LKTRQAVVKLREPNIFLGGREEGNKRGATRTERPRNRRRHTGEKKAGLQKGHAAVSGAKTNREEGGRDGEKKRKQGGAKAETGKLAKDQTVPIASWITHNERQDHTHGTENR